MPKISVLPPTPGLTATAVFPESQSGTTYKTTITQIATGAVTTAITGTTVLDDTAFGVSFTCTGAAPYTITLPNIDIANANQRVQFKLYMDAGVAVTIDGSGGQTIDGQAQIIGVTGCNIELYVSPDGTQWYSNFNFIGALFMNQGVTINSTGNQFFGNVNFTTDPTTVSTTAVNSNSLIFLSKQEGWSDPSSISVSTRTEGQGFDITSSAFPPQGSIAWMIINRY